jgi:hypothetical protein
VIVAEVGPCTMMISIQLACDIGMRSGEELVKMHSVVVESDDSSQRACGCFHNR